MSIPSPRPSGQKSPLATAAAGTLMLLRCAGPLIAAGAGLAVVGGVLRHPWVAAMGAMIVLMAAVHVLRCHVLRGRGAAGPDGCCPNVPLPGAAGDRPEDTPGPR